MILLSENIKWFPLKKYKKFNIYTYFQIQIYYVAD